MMTHTRKLVSAACLALLSTSYSVSNSQVVTTAPIVAHQLGDDGYAHVPLGFSFPFYGQTFTESWMYDNGVISFKQPGTAGALSPWQWNSQELKNSMASYFIASLWSDIAPNSGTTYTTQGDASSMKYSWNNISQFYGGAPALNTFTTTIKSDGSIFTSYYSLGLNLTNVSVGTVGDHTQQQYDQKYYAPAGTVVVNGTIADWSTGAAPIQVDPCKDNPLYSPKCPGYGAAYIASIQPQTTTTTAPTTTTETVAAPVVEVIAAPVQQTTVTSTSAPTQTSAPAVAQQTTPVASTSSSQTQTSSKATESSRSAPTVSLSTILNIVRSEQSRIANTEKSVVQEAVSTAVAASQSAREGAESVAATASNAASSGTGLSLAGFGNNSSSKTVSLGSAFSMSTTDRLVVDFMQERNQTVDQQQQSQQNESVKKNVQNNEAAAGVNIASLATLPIGYASYFVMMPDNQFYQPKEIYKNQSVVDNARALRQMSSDRLHRDLVDLQYNRKGN